MKISPENIKKQEFSKSMRGFNVEEVKAFLEKFADDINDLQNENESLKKELEDLNIRFFELKKTESSIKETVLKTQENASKTMESAKKRTDLLIKEAEIKAARILEKTKESAKEIRDSLITLREERELIVAKLKTIINSQARLLDMKVTDAGEETVQQKEIVHKDKIDLDINSIIDKLGPANR